MEYSLSTTKCDQLTRQKKGNIVAYNKMVFKGTVVTLIVLFVGLLVVDNIMFDPDQGIITRGELELSWVEHDDVNEAYSIPVAVLIHFVV